MDLQKNIENLRRKEQHIRLCAYIRKLRKRGIGNNDDI